MFYGLLIFLFETSLLFFKIIRTTLKVHYFKMAHIHVLFQTVRYSRLIFVSAEREFNSNRVVQLINLYTFGVYHTRPISITPKARPYHQQMTPQAAL